MRKITLATNCIYHVFNRGVEKREIYLNPSYYSRFVSILEHYLKYNYPYSLLRRRLEKAQSPGEKQNILRQLETKRVESPVEIISFCLMPNHYHLTLKQLVEAGITNFMHRIGTAYTGYFNIRQERSGRLYETIFRAVMVESEEQLLHLSRYQHLNPRVLGLTSKELASYSWSSLSTYLGENRFPFIKPEVVMSSFKSPKSYLDFVLAEIDEFEPLRLQKITIDDDLGWFAAFRALEDGRRKQLRNHYLKAIS